MILEGLKLLEAIYNKWGSKYVTGEENPPKPGLICFNNLIPALEMLHKHIDNKSKIVVHCDVDMDGIGSGYILKRFISQLSPTAPRFVINREKVHGIKKHQIPILSKSGIDLLIIVDSSSNEVNIFKEMNCDVLVIDHHEILHSDTIGRTSDGLHNFIIVNNMLGNSDSLIVNEWLKKINPEASYEYIDYHGEPQMSCGLVIYELLRSYCLAYRQGSILEDMGLYQWAGVTLFTDAISLINDRNQWYITNTVHSMYTEPTLLAMIQAINSYNHRLTKSIINYSLAPTINKAIRAGASGDALSIVLNEPSRITELSKYRSNQEAAIAEGVKDVQVYDSFVLKDLTGTGIMPSYCGVIASKLVDEYGKNAVVYITSGDRYQGSFRGRQSQANYRLRFEQYNPENYAQGHAQAFGVAGLIENLTSTMSALTEVESEVSSKRYLTMGDIPDSEKGQYHIDDFEGFKRASGLMMIGNGNSKVSSDEQIIISVPSSLASLIEIKGKLYLYNILGLKCKAFNPITPGMINLYAETTDACDFYIK